MDFIYGTIIADIPQDLVPPEMWPEYGSIANPPSICSREEVGISPKGTRWGLWPLYFEAYTSDKEPNLEESKKGFLALNRLLEWKRVARTDVPRGWYAFSKKPSRIDGIYIFKDSADYKKDWSRVVRRNLNIWETEYSARYVIERIPLNEFKDAYKKSTVAKKVGLEGLYIIERKHALPLTKEHMELWGVRNKQSGAIVAGTAIHYSPTYRGSVHEAPFVLPEGQEVHAMAALFDHWFSECVRRKIAILFMTFFWYQGMPKGWRGFSRFKSHFGLQYVAYPPTLSRFVRGRLY